jgi:dTDP-L-rhamnose 4-epimerase
MKILVTGGAGFIGSHVVERCEAAGHDVVRLDNFDPQVHGEVKQKQKLDITKPAHINRAIKGCDAVIHLAAAVGVGQAEYMPAHYTHTNCYGTAQLLEAMTRHKVNKLVVASSMSIYGEGLWSGGISEDSPKTTESIYGYTKRYQEDISKIWARQKAGKRRVIALRLFNCYGPGQSLNNPYTGFLAMAVSRYVAGKPMTIYEDGMQTRDFIHVYDVADAFMLALADTHHNFGVFNIGTGRREPIIKVARRIAQLAGYNGKIEATGESRKGDIRHCSAATSAASNRLGFTAKVKLEEGLRELVEWARLNPGECNLEKANKELKKARLLK